MIVDLTREEVEAIALLLRADISLTVQGEVGPIVAQRLLEFGQAKQSLRDKVGALLNGEDVTHLGRDYARSND